MQTWDTPRRALFVLLLGSIVLVVLVIRPLGEAIVVAAVLSAAFGPLHQRLTARLRGRYNVAATVIVAGLVTLVLAPIVGMSTFIVQQSADAMTFVSTVLRGEEVDALVARLPDMIEDRLRAWVDVNAAVGGQGGQGGAAALSAITATVTATGTLVYQTVIMLLALFFFLTHKDDVIAWLDDASPLEVRQTRELLAEVGRVSVSVVSSTLLTAGVQSLAALVGFLIAGMPYPFFFAVTTFFVAMIPAVGAAIACLAAAAILLAIGNTFWAIFLAAWSLLVVGLVDNLLKPLLIRNQVRMHGIIVLFSLLGGLGAFGPIGLLVGPLALALFISILRIYRRDYGVGAPEAAHP